MRRSEVTPELIELSKRAKELGFPQDVEEGDWVKPYEYIVLFNPMSMCIEGEIIRYANGLICDNWFLILSFSRCLEWLQKEKYGVNLAFNTFIWDQYIFFVGTQSSRAKIHHEAIAKAVVKILEKN